jgi:hypothetical protein
MSSKIGVLSDTHLTRYNLQLPQQLIEDFKGADLILHAGDLVDLSVLERLKELAPVKAVFGNMDHLDVRKTLPEKEIIQVGKLKIGLIHGWGPPDGLIKLVMNVFKEQRLDAIIYGHSHRPDIEKIGETLFLNPGSPTDKIFAPYNSYGLLQTKDKLTGQIIRLE